MVTIDLLSNHPAAIPALAKLWYDEKAREELHPHMTFAEACTRFTPPHDVNELPLLIAAFIDGKPVGVCGLRADVIIRPDLSPWVFGLVVDPAYRNQGIAGLLLKGIMREAIKLSYQKLYLLTFIPALSAWFAGFGWRNIGTEQYREHSVVVMEIDLFSELYKKKKSLFEKGGRLAQRDGGI